MSNAKQLWIELTDMDTHKHTLIQARRHTDTPWIYRKKIVRNEHTSARVIVVVGMELY